jgi:hypothetical protein
MGVVEHPQMVHWVAPAATQFFFLFFSFFKKIKIRFRDILGRFSLTNPHASHMGLFMSKKINLSNGWPTMKMFRTWLWYIANIFHFGKKKKKGETLGG